MLHNPQLDISEAEFKAWLKEQDPTKEFTYLDVDTCAAAQFLKSKGLDWDSADPNRRNKLDVHAGHAWTRVSLNENRRPTLGDVLREIERVEEFFDATTP